MTDYQKPKYHTKTFKTMQQFDAWLKEKTKYIIYFEDKGQDFLRWYLDERGEVIESRPFQNKIWNGTMVRLDSVRKGRYVWIKTRTADHETQINYKLIKVERL